MFNCQILQKEKLQTVLLLHGLYATAGFWLPVLRCFPRHRIVLLNINYDKFLSATDGLTQLSEFMRRPYLLPNDNVHVIGHSFGSFLSASLNLPALRRYHLCPVFHAQHADLLSLQAEVGIRLGAAAPVSHLVLLQMERALLMSQTVDSEIIASRGDCFLIPDADPFFCYRPLPSGADCFRYRGGHFDVAEPLDFLFSIGKYAKH
jgi:hypothetical protein